MTGVVLLIVASLGAGALWAAWTLTRATGRPRNRRGDGGADDGGFGSGAAALSWFGSSDGCSDSSGGDGGSCGDGGGGGD